SATAVVIVLTGLAVGWMLVFFARSGARHPVLPVALGLVIGGSVSSLVDRVRLGHVTDFLDLKWWPAFNLADSFIVVGVALLRAPLVPRDHPAAGRATGTLVHALVGIAAGGEEERRGIVHRLDRDTSGLIVVARTEDAYRKLQSLVKRRGLEREYSALVRGRPRSRTGRIEAP